LRTLDTGLERETLRLLIDPDFSGDLPIYSHEVDWEYIEGVASFHRILNLIAYNILHSDKLKILPAKITHNFRDRLKKTTIRHLLVSREIAQISIAFNSMRIPYAILKGPVLADEVYPSISARSYGDLDIFVPREKHRDAYNILRELRYTQTKFNPKTGLFEAINEGDKDRYLRTQHSYPFRKILEDRMSLSIDLHWSFGGILDDFTLNEKILLEGSLPFKVMNVDSWRLSNENLLLHACLHHYWHFRNNMHIKLGRICDIAYILWRFRHELDEDLFYKYVEVHNIRSPISFSLYQVNRLYPGLIKQGFLQGIEDDKVLGDLQVGGFCKTPETCKATQLICSPIYESPKLRPEILNLVLEAPNSWWRIYGRLYITLLDEKNPPKAGSLLPEGARWLRDSNGSYILSSLNLSSRDVLNNGEYIASSGCSLEGSIIPSSDWVRFKIKVDNEEDEKTLKRVKFIFRVSYQDIWAKGKESLLVETEKGLESLPVKENFSFTVSKPKSTDLKDNERALKGNFIGAHNEESDFGLILINNHLTSVLRSYAAENFIQIVADLGEIPPRMTKETTVHLHIGFFNDLKAYISQENSEDKK
jgi:hypothetical protein